VKIIKAYCNTDPGVTIRNQGFVYIISGLLELSELDDANIFLLLRHIMFSLEWRNHYLKENDENNNLRVRELHASVKELVP